jgi:hypothetical protein
VTVRQFTLFGAEPRPLPSAEGLDQPVADGAATAGADDRQIELFAQPVVLGRAMEAALAAGRFELAARLRVVLDETYGPSPRTQALGFLARLGAAVRDGPLGVPLSAWAEIDAQLAGHTHLRHCLRGGVFARLLATHTPEALVETRPECLPALAAVLASGREGSPEAGRRRARGLVRDALLAGRNLSSLDFEHDEAVADLLAEDLPPRWLACLGLIRRLWSATPPDEAGLEGFQNTTAEDRLGEEAALEFWRCLQVAETADCPEEMLHEARRSMKGLRPELHALYMRRATGMRGS